MTLILLENKPYSHIYKDLVVWQKKQHHHFLPRLDIIPSVLEWSCFQTGILFFGFELWYILLKIMCTGMQTHSHCWGNRNGGGGKVLVAYNCASQIQSKYCCRLVRLSLNKLHWVICLSQYGHIRYIKWFFGQLSKPECTNTYCT